MAFGKSSRGSRTTRSRKSYGRKTSAYKKVIKPTRQALPALAKQVANIKRAIKPLTMNKLFYNNVGQLSLGNATGQDAYGVVNMSSTGSWGRVFGTDADDEQSHSFMQNYTKMFWQLNAAVEPQLINYTLMCVSLTKAGATELFNPAAGTLNTLASGVHFIRPSASLNGMGTMINKKYFNIHYYKTLYTITSTGYQGDGSPIRRGSFAIKKPIEWKAPNGDWRSKSYNPNAVGNLYFIIFNNNSTADFENPTFDWNILINGTAV